MAKKRKKSSKKPKLSERKKLLQSINRSIKYREKQGYIFDPEYKAQLQRKQTKSLRGIKQDISFELGQHSVYIDPLTNSTMKGAEARSYRRQISKQKRKQEKEKKEQYQFQDLDDEYTFEMSLDQDVLSILDWLKSNIMMLPDTRIFRGKTPVDYSGYKSTLLSYIDDRLVVADVEQTNAYLDYIKQSEAQLVNSFEIVKYSSVQTTVNAAYRTLFDVLKGGPLTLSEAQEVEELNEYYEDFESEY